MLPDRLDQWPPADVAEGLTLIEKHKRLWDGTTTSQDTYPKGAVRVPMPADVAEVSADLLFSEPPVAVAPKTPEERDAEYAAGQRARAANTRFDAPEAPERDAQQAILDRVFNTPAVYTVLREAAEVASAMGGVYLRVAWDSSFLDRPVPTLVDPTNAVPVFRFGRLERVTFWSEQEHDHYTYRLLEQHSAGRVEYGLYRGDRRVPLDEVPALAYLASIVDADSGFSVPEGVKTAIYIPNVLPNRRWRTGTLASFGRSDYYDAEHLFLELDKAFGSWMRDVQLARGRLIAARDVLQPRGRGRGAKFDFDQEVFTPVEMPTDPNQLITPVQFQIRVDEHERTCLEIVQTILRRAGLSESSFGAADGLETATGVKAKQQMSERTRDKKVVFWREALPELIRGLAAVDTLVYGQPELTRVPDVKFPADIQVDFESMARTISTMRGAKAVSVETSVRMLHPEWDSATVNDEVQRIQMEEGFSPAPDPSLTRF